MRQSKFQSKQSFYNDKMGSSSKEHNLKSIKKKKASNTASQYMVLKKLKSKFYSNKLHTDMWKGQEHPEWICLSRENFL